MEKKILLIFWLKTLIKSYLVISIHLLAWRYFRLFFFYFYYLTADILSVIVYLNPYIIFLFFSFYLFSLIWFFFFFYFLDNEEICDHGHMMYHMNVIL